MKAASARAEDPQPSLAPQQNSIPASKAKKLEASHAANIKKILAEHVADLETLQKSHDIELLTLKTTHSSAMAELEAKLMAKVDAEEKNCASITEFYEDKLKTAETDLQAKMEETNELGALVKKVEKILKAKEDELETKTKELQHAQIEDSCFNGAVGAETSWIRFGATV